MANAPVLFTARYSTQLYGSTVVECVETSRAAYTKN